MPNLPRAARTELLAVARATLEAYLAGQGIPRYQPLHEALKERRGAFVTLRHGDELRGCIGRLLAEEALYLTVQACAVSAAVEDARFIPVRSDELPDLTLEISVLSEFERIMDVAQIEVGRHGLWIVRGDRRGLLLPQVATENDWDRETFLEQTCRKACLPADAWRDTATSIHAFEAEVFSE